MNATKITVGATVEADINKAWELYTKPEHITNWNFAIDDWQCPRAENDLRAGGRYSARMEAKDGSFGFDFEATYDEVTPKEGFVYTMADGRKASTTFKDLGEKTQITIIFDAETQNPEEMQKGGWQAILNNFKKYAESN